ncbi:MAG: hypothetical protein ACJ760_08445 [Thermoleophilaceae bacterium]
MIHKLRDRISRMPVVRVVAIPIALGAAASPAPAASASSFVDTTPGVKAFTVPAGVHSLNLRETAGAGGDVIDSSGTTLVAGGRAALVTGTVGVFPGEQLQLTVATSGGNANVSTGTTGGAGGPEGGAGGYSAAGGGGATRVLGCQSVACSIAVIAGGGGGGGANGYYSPSISNPTLPGGPGGAGGASGGNGTSYIAAGGIGGGPGTSGAAGTGGGSGFQAGADGSGPDGGAGGNQTSSFASGEGGGGGGGGLFGGGGGGSGGTYTDGTNYVYAGGGGGGGGSSLAPSGGAVQAAAAHAAPSVVLTWIVVVPVVSKLTRSPSAFVAAQSGPSAIPANGGPGTRVDYTLNEAASVRFTVLRSLPGRKAKGGRCVKPTKSNRNAHKCTRLVAVPGSFTRASSGGTNSFRFTGRIAGQKLKAGKYRLLATPSTGGKTGRAASVSFQIVS